MAKTSVGEAIKSLEKVGFSKRNQVGSHITYIKDDKRITLVLHSSPKELLSHQTSKQLKQLLNDSNRQYSN